MNCIVCQQKMKFVRKFTTVKGRQGNYNINKYKCPHCEYEENIALDGENDFDSMNALNDVRRYFKQQERNQL